MRKRLLLIGLVILALGLIGTSLSTLYEQVEFMPSQNQPKVKVFYGFPLSWHGYSLMEMPIPSFTPPPLEYDYWFSSESLLLDAVFWFAISLFASVAAMKSVKILLKTIAPKVVATYFLASASFSIVGVSLFFFSCEDFGLRLYAIGLFLLAATYYQSLIGTRRTPQKSKIAVTKFCAC
jgi:hypothetical protein